MIAAEKSPTAFRTIGEVSTDLGIPQHILRFWESKFPLLRPVKRSGNRRYYRPEDVALIQRIDQLLNHQGYTIAGVQRLLKQRDSVEQDPAEQQAAMPAAPAMPVKASGQSQSESGPSLSGDSRFDRAALKAIRDMLADALDRTRIA